MYFDALASHEAALWSVLGDCCGRGHGQGHRKSKHSKHTPHLSISFTFMGVCSRLYSRPQLIAA